MQNPHTRYKPQGRRDDETYGAESSPGDTDTSSDAAAHKSMPLDFETQLTTAL